VSGAGLARYFEVEERGSTVRTELRGGLATFFTMAYIVVLNPIVLAGAGDVTGRHLDIGQAASSTALVAAVMTILMGVVGRYPFAIAAGLGLNGVVAFQLAAQMSWPAAMGVVVLEGLAITALVLTGVRQSIFDAVPLALKNAIAVGIGLATPSWWPARCGPPSSSASWARPCSPSCSTPSSTCRPRSSPASRSIPGAGA
jgi:AGZA family xanthine/uracil permease-like MFS transporter